MKGQLGHTLGASGEIETAAVLAMMRHGVILPNANLAAVAEDCADTVDIGLTFTRKPRLAVYGCFASVWCLGYANLDARFLGVGGGWVGSVKLKANCRGMSYTGREQIIWSKNARWRHYSHPMGLDAVLAGTRIPPPAYFPACTHYIHVGPVGAVANLRYAEMLDLILGFTTFDLACDDGLERGDWFFYD